MREIAEVTRKCHIHFKNPETRCYMRGNTVLIELSAILCMRRRWVVQGIPGIVCYGV